MRRSASAAPARPLQLHFLAAVIRPLAIACLSLLATAPLCAQADAITAHPQETLQNTSGNFAPLGVLPGGVGAEARSLLLIPRHELPCVPSTVTAIEVHCPAAATVDYASLEILFGPTTATGLNLAFGPNFSAAPWPARQASNVQVAYGAGWTRIPLGNPYPHDGASSLLLEFRKVVQPGPQGYPFASMATSSSPARLDRPPMVHGFGGPGSGAANAPVAGFYATAMVVRLVWSGTPTLRHRSNLAASGNQYGLGGSVTLTMQGSPGQLYLIAADANYLPPGFALPGITGELRLAAPISFASGLLGLSGEDGAVVAIPNNPALVGTFLAYQGATYDIASQAITLTNATDHFVNL